MKLAFDTDAGVGRRARLGVVVLQADETLEPELARVTALDGVALYHSRIPMAPEIRADTLAAMERDLPGAVRMFPEGLGFDVIGYGCTSGATVIGSRNVARAIRSVFPDAQVTDPLAAIIAAARALGVRRLGFVTPYVPEVSRAMRAALEDAGLAIASFGSFGEGDDRVVARISETSILRAAEQVAGAAPCDAVVIACTNLRCLAVLEQIEHRTGVAAISSNQALGWHMLRLAGVEDTLPGLGKLFTR